MLISKLLKLPYGVRYTLCYTSRNYSIQTKLQGQDIFVAPAYQRKYNTMNNFYDQIILNKYLPNYGTYIQPMPVSFGRSLCTTYSCVHVYTMNFMTQIIIHYIDTVLPVASNPSFNNTIMQMDINRIWSSKMFWYK